MEQLMFEKECEENSKKEICPECKKPKELTNHSLIGSHRPPYTKICRDCHDKKHNQEKKNE